MNSRWIEGSHLDTVSPLVSSLGADGDLADEWMPLGAVLVMPPHVPVPVVSLGLVHVASVVSVMEIVRSLAAQLLCNLAGVLPGDGPQLGDLLAVASGTEEAEPMPATGLVQTAGYPSHLLVVIGHEQMAVQTVTVRLCAVELLLSITLLVASSSLFPEHRTLRTRAGLGLNFVGWFPVSDMSGLTMLQKRLFVVSVCVVTEVLAAVFLEVGTDGARAGGGLLGGRGSQHHHGGDED